MSNYYSLIWKSSNKISPKDLLNERPCEEYYFDREVDRFLKKILSEKKNAMITGPPLSGKTRAFYNAVKHNNVKFYILATRNILMNHFLLPAYYRFSSNRIIFIDDFQNYIEKQDSFSQLLKSAKAKDIPVIVTCHSGKEFIKAKNKLIENNLDADILFGDNIYEIGKISHEEGKKIAERMGREWQHISFNGTIGSIFMKLNEMERRFEQSGTIEKTILRAMRSLYVCGIYTDNTFFRMDRIKKVAAQSELEGKDFEWTGWIKSLEEKEFIQFAKRNLIWAEDAYLEYIVKPETEISKIELFEDIIHIFNDDAEALQMAGERAYDTSSASIEIIKYLRLSISSFEKVYEIAEITNDKQKIFSALKYLGTAYWSLCKLENVKENSLYSINYFNKIFNRSDLDLQPSEIALIKSRIGNTHSVIAESENKKENCLKAIDLFNEALYIYSKEKYPMEYAQVKNSLGGAYMMLSDDEDAKLNLSKAAECFEDSLRVRTIDIDPKGYAYSKLNLANTYARLSQIENGALNLDTALNFYNDTLKIYLKEKYPIEFGKVHNNIGNVYFLLAQISDTKENYKHSMESYKKALEVRSSENTPVLYSNTIYNLSDTYRMIGETENDPAYIKKALSCLNELLGISASNLTPFRIGEIYFISGRCFTLLAEYESGPDNYTNAIQYYEKSKDIFKDNDFNDMYNKSIEELEKSRVSLDKILKNEI